MIIKELKEKIALLDDNMKVGGSGHFGEFLECWDAFVYKAYMERKYNEHKDYLCLIKTELDTREHVS